MIARNKVLEVLEREFPGTSATSRTAAAEAIVGLPDDWEEVTSREGDLGYHYSGFYWFFSPTFPQAVLARCAGNPATRGVLLRNPSESFAKAHSDAWPWSCSLVRQGQHSPSMWPFPACSFRWVRWFS
jgi:hypothetical protein